MAQKDILTDNEILSHYVKMGEVISEMFKPHLEVIIHDLRFPEHSIRKNGGERYFRYWL